MRKITIFSARCQSFNLTVAARSTLCCGEFTQPHPALCMEPCAKFCSAGRFAVRRQWALLCRVDFTRRPAYNVKRFMLWAARPRQAALAFALPGI